MLATFSVDGLISTFTLNRPDARNALSIDMLRDMHAAIEQAQSAAARGGGGPIVMILTGAGRSFCAGMDLKQVLGDPDKPRELLTSLADFTVKLRNLPLLTIASVNGAAIGGGCGLVTVCDFALTHAEAKLGFPEVDMGVCPAVVAPWLVKKVGAGRARAILLQGGLMNGREAQAAGLVGECVDSSEGLGNAVRALAERLATGGPSALRVTKHLLNELDGSAESSGVERRAAELSASVLATPEAQAMLRAKMGA